LWKPSPPTLSPTPRAGQLVLTLFLGSWENSVLDKTGTSTFLYTYICINLFFQKEVRPVPFLMASYKFVVSWIFISTPSVCTVPVERNGIFRMSGECKQKGWKNNLLNDGKGFECSVADQNNIFSSCSVFR
jgi:hypothetical protein